MKDKNNIFQKKNTKNAKKLSKKGGKHPFFKLLPTYPQGSVGGVFNRPENKWYVIKEHMKEGTCDRAGRTRVHTSS